METYEKLNMEVIAFENADVVITSTSDTDTPEIPGQN